VVHSSTTYRFDPSGAGGYTLLFKITLAVLLAVLSSCGGGGGGAGGGTGGGVSAFVGVWQYQQGSFAFLNCFLDSHNVALTGTGFQIVNEGGNLVRIGVDGCRLNVVQTTATHASGVSGQECTVHVTDPSGNPLTAHYQVKTLVMELKPSDASQMVEVIDLPVTQTTTLGTVNCEISGNNTLNRAP
jgi:hypothetical protein